MVLLASGIIFFPSLQDSDETSSHRDCGKQSEIQFWIVLSEIKKKLLLCGLRWQKCDYK